MIKTIAKEMLGLSLYGFLYYYAIHQNSAGAQNLLVAIPWISVAILSLASVAVIKSANVIKTALKSLGSKIPSDEELAGDRAVSEGMKKYKFTKALVYLFLFIYHGYFLTGIAFFLAIVMNMVYEEILSNSHGLLDFSKKEVEKHEQQGK